MKTKNSPRFMASLLMLLLVSGCSTGDRYDGLKVADGDGHVYELSHNIGDNYFVRKVDGDPQAPHAEANKKLELRIGN